MRRRALCLLLWLGAVANAQTSYSPTPSVWAGGAVSPSIYPCDITVAPSGTIAGFIQINAGPGQALWYCGYNSATSSWQWFQRNSAGLAGTSLNLVNQGGAVSTTVLCPSDTTCPAGYYQLSLSVVVTTAGTLGSITNITVAFTDDGGAASINVAAATSSTCPSLSLLTVNARCSIVYTFYKTSSTSVTVATTLGTLGGSPKYSFRAALMQVF